MKIIELRASNFARLRAVEIRPSGPMVPITGANSEGKSSVLRSIWAALKGRAAAPPRPIHDGAEEAIIRLDLGVLKITRRFKRDADGADYTTDLSVVDQDGGRVRKTPQALIDGLLGDLSFDPLAFARMSPRDQFERLKVLVPAVDFDKLAKERKAIYDERTIVNRRARDELSIANQIAGSLPEGPKPDPVNTADVVVELSRATERNSKRAAAIADVAAKRSNATQLRRNAEDLQRSADKMIARAVEAEADADEIEASIPAAVDTEEFTRELSRAEHVTAIIRAFEEYQAHLDANHAATVQSVTLGRELDNLDEAVTATIAAAALPGGVTLDPRDDGQVLLRGKPFNSAGTAEKILASTEIGMAVNPNLRVMLVDEGSELDSTHMAMLADLAAERDYQIWVARVEEGEGGVGFRIEDGAVVSAAGPGKITQRVLDRAKGGK